MTKQEYQHIMFRFLDACKNNDTEFVREFIGKGIDLNKNFYFPIPPGFLLPLPLIHALEYRAFDVARVLLKHGADPYAICQKRLKTPADVMPPGFIIS